MNEDLHAANGRTLIPDWNFSGIYMIRNSVNSKIYIGQAQNIRARIVEHRRRRNGGPTHLKYSPLYKAVRKYGGWAAFEFLILEHVENLSLLDEREAFWIDHTKSYDRAIGYNLRREPRTSRGWHHSKETKDKISQMARQRISEGWISPFRGVSPPRERVEKCLQTKLKNPKRWRLSEATLKKHKINGVKRRKRIIQIDAVTKIEIAVWLAIDFVVEAFDISRGAIMSALRRGNRTAGFYWKYYSTEMI